MKKEKPIILILDTIETWYGYFTDTEKLQKILPEFTIFTTKLEGTAEYKLSKMHNIVLVIINPDRLNNPTGFLANHVDSRKIPSLQFSFEPNEKLKTTEYLKRDNLLLGFEYLADKIKEVLKPKNHDPRQRR